MVLHSFFCISMNNYPYFFILFYAEKRKNPAHFFVPSHGIYISRFGMYIP